MTEAGRTRILIVDDHPMVREGLSLILNREADMAVAAHCGSSKEALEILSEGGVDFTFLDFDLGGATATGFVSQAREAGYRGPVVILTGGASPTALTGLLAEGAAGIVLKSGPLDELATCVREVMAGATWIPQQYLTNAIHGLTHPSERRKANLSPREREVLQLVLEGRLTKEIAGHIGVTETAVKGTLQQLFEKTGVRKRSQLVRYAFEHYREEMHLDL